MGRQFGLRFATLSVASILAAASFAIGVGTPAAAPARVAPAVESIGQETTIAFPGGPVFRRTSAEVSAARVIRPDASPIAVALWDENDADGTKHFWAVALDGRNADAVEQSPYLVRFRYDQFDPLQRQPVIEPELLQGAPGAGQGGVCVAQFYTPPLDAYRDRIAALGGRIHTSLTDHSFIVRLPHDRRAELAAEPWVRWVGDYHPAYKLSPGVLDLVRAGEVGVAGAARDYTIDVMEMGLAYQAPVAQRIEAVGGRVIWTAETSLRFEASLTVDQLLAVLPLDEVLFVDFASGPEEDMDVVRQFGGATFVKPFGFEGQGVRGEVMDGALRTTHEAFKNPPPLIHGANGTSTSHGTSTYGIVFARDFPDIRGTGMLPKREQGIFASYNRIGGGVTRWAHTAELVDPAGPYRAVFQSNSWGNTTTTVYNNYSREMDQIIFDLDIVITQSQSNTGNRNSRPQAWAKNIVSVGAISHYDTLDRGDDRWTSASIGPAEDNRVKPDLAYFYDLIYTTTSTSDSAYRTDFCCTSAATPVVAGHLGILFQMWHQGVFSGHGGGDDVFDSRPHAATIKALAINTAAQWDFVGENHNLTRVHQGWGNPDVRNAYNARSNIFIVNETDVLTQFKSTEYLISVPQGAPALKATLVYNDPPGTTSAQQHRINDLSLSVVAPNGTTYHGNAGLRAGVWSTPGGSPNTLDTVENVFIQLPMPGTWKVVVRAAEINADSHIETPAVDADYALVVTGGTLASSCYADCNGDRLLDIRDFFCFQSAFAARDPYADCDKNSVFDIRDFFCFQSAFAGGCR